MRPPRCRHPACAGRARRFGSRPDPSHPYARARQVPRLDTCPASRGLRTPQTGRSTPVPGSRRPSCGTCDAASKQSYKGSRLRSANLGRVPQLDSAKSHDEAMESPAFSLGLERHLSTKVSLLIPRLKQDRDRLKGGWRSISTSWASEQIERRRITRSDRKSTRLNSSDTVISYAVFCWKKKIPAEVGRGCLTR